MTRTRGGLCFLLLGLLVAAPAGRAEPRLQTGELASRREAMTAHLRERVKERLRAARDGGAHERDDPVGRAAAREVLQAERDPAAQVEILQAAAEEARRAGLRWAGFSAQAAVKGNAWVSLGPDNAAFAQNGSSSLAKIDSGRAKRILVHPTNPDTVYFAVSGGGVWKTFNASRPIGQGGPSWLPIGDAIGSLSIGSLAMNPNDPESLLLGLGDFHDVKTPGLVHSEDGGQTWGPSPVVVLSGKYTLNGTTYTATSVRDIQFDPTGNGTVLVATDVGIFRAGSFGQVTSSGWTLTDVSANSVTGNKGEVNACWSLAWAGPQTWLATCQNFGATSVVNGYGAGRLVKSLDGGATWAEYTSRLPGDPSVASQPGLIGLGRMTLAAAPAKTITTATKTRVYALAATNLYQASKSGFGQQQKDIFVSTDGGEAWASLGAYAGSGKKPTNAFTNASFGLQDDLDVVHYQADYNQALAVDPNNVDNLLVGGNLAMLRSKDAGKTWDLMSFWLPDPRAAPNGNLLPTKMYVHTDWHAMALSYAGGSLTFWAGTDGGLFRSTDVLSAAAGQATFDDAPNHGLVTHLAYSVATGAQKTAGGACAPGANGDLVFGGLQDNGTRLRALSGPTPSTFNAVTGGDGFGVAMGCATGSATMGSLLLASYVAQINRSTDGGASFNLSNCCNETDGSCFVGGTLDTTLPVNSRICKSQMGTACPSRSSTTPADPTDQCTALDVYYNFVMVLAGDQADPKGQTVLVPVTDGSAHLFGGSANPDYHHGTIWASSDGGGGWASSGSFQLTSGAVAATMPAPAFEVSSDGKTYQNWVATSHVPQPSSGEPTGFSTVYVTRASDSNWLEVQPIFQPGTATAQSRYLPVKTAALDWSDATAGTVWAGSQETSLYCSASSCCTNNNCVPKNAAVPDFVPATMGHVFRTKNARAGPSAVWTAQGQSGSGLPYVVPVNVLKVDPGDANTVYAGTELGLYKGTYCPGPAACGAQAADTTTWVRYGAGLPLVSVTDLAIAADGSSIRIATFGRGFWEIFPKAGGSLAGVPGNGDLDHNQQIDAFDLVREAALLLTSSADDDYNGAGNLVGAANLIDASDVIELVKKLGGRP